jgi:hypothetical protein
LVGRELFNLGKGEDIHGRDNGLGHGGGLLATTATACATSTGTTSSTGTTGIGTTGGVSTSTTASAATSGAGSGSTATAREDVDVSGRVASRGGVHGVLGLPSSGHGGHHLLRVDETLGHVTTLVIDGLTGRTIHGSTRGSLRHATSHSLKKELELPLLSLVPTSTTKMTS